MQPSELYLFAGLPGSGKSTIAHALAQQLECTYLRIDTIEQALRDFYPNDITGEGYHLAYSMAADNLRLGRNVIADSCNPIQLTRNAWQQVAEDCGCGYRNIEIICSDAVEHQRRVESRRSAIAGLVLPTWQQVLDREYDRWTSDRIIIDTAGRTVTASVNELLEKLDF